MSAVSFMRFSSLIPEPRIPLASRPRGRQADRARLAEPCRPANGHVPYLTYSSHFTGDLHCSILFDPAVCVVWPFPTYTRERESSLNPSIFEYRLHKSALHDVPGCGVSLCTAQASWCSSGCNSTRL
jgi:hypothetical protein